MLDGSGGASCFIPLGRPRFFISVSMASMMAAGNRNTRLLAAFLPLALSVSQAMCSNAFSECNVSSHLPQTEGSSIERGRFETLEKVFREVCLLLDERGGFNSLGVLCRLLGGIMCFCFLRAKIAAPLPHLTAFLVFPFFGMFCSCMLLSCTKMLRIISFFMHGIFLLVGVALYFYEFMPDEMGLLPMIIYVMLVNFCSFIALPSLLWYAAIRADARMEGVRRRGKALLYVFSVFLLIVPLGLFVTPLGGWAFPRKFCMASHFFILYGLWAISLGYHYGYTKGKRSLEGCWDAVSSVWALTLSTAALVTLLFQKSLLLPQTGSSPLPLHAQA